MDLVGNSGDQGDQEGRGRQPASALHQPHEGEFSRPINGDEQVQIAFSGLNIGDIYVEEADRVGLELFLRLLVARDRGLSADPVPLQRYRCSDERVRCGIAACQA